MSNRLPENEAEFRLVDPIAEEYRLKLTAYQQMFMGVICDDWLAKGKPENLNDFIIRRVRESMIGAANVGGFDGGLDNEIPVVSYEILDSICAEWSLPPFKEMIEKFYEDGDPTMPDVFREAFDDA